MQIKSPVEIAGAAENAGYNKAELTRKSLFSITFIAMAIAAGAFIALGGLLSVVVGFGMPEATSANPGLQRLLSGLVFPIGLVLVVVLGAELFTGNNALLIPSLANRKISLCDILLNWTAVWVGNFVGALLVAWLFAYVAGVTAVDPWHAAIVKMATTKSTLPWLTVFVRGIGANWCVCLAVWLALSGHTLTEKVVGCWLPVMAFVALGYEHCVANMFFIPLGMMEGADVTVVQLFTDNLVPATIGNIVGGALFVGVVHGVVRLKQAK